MIDDVAWFNDVLTQTEIENVRDNGVAALSADPNLVAHWDLDQAAGDIAVDNANGIELHLSTNGIVPFGPEFRPGQGQFGGALEFDGADDFATFQDASFDVGEKGTLNVWVKMDDVGKRNQLFEGPDDSGMEFQFRNNSGGQMYGRANAADTDEYVIRDGPDGVIQNNWANIQAVWDFNGLPSEYDPDGGGACNSR